MEVFILSDSNIIRELYGLYPTSVKGQLNSRTLYYRNRLFRRLMSIIKFYDYPDTWDIEYLKKILLNRGYICIGDMGSYGVLPLECTFAGLNIYSRPIECIIANHFIHDKTLKIGEDCVLLHLQNDYQGVGQYLNIYAEKLASIDAAIDVNLINTKAAWIFDCDGKAQEETAKKIYDDITAGRPAVFTRVNSNSLNGDGKIGITMLNVKNTFIADSLQDLKRTIRYEFLTDFGINNANVDKKERVNTLEVESNDDELDNAIDDWKTNLEGQIAEVNKMFGLNIEIEFPYYRKKEIRNERA